MKFLFVLVFCFCSLFGRTFDDVIDEAHEKLMLETYKGQEQRYYKVKAEKERLEALYPKDTLRVRNCITKIFSTGESSLPNNCRPGTDFIGSLKKIHPMDNPEITDLFSTHIYIGLKKRGAKIYSNSNWIHMFKRFPDLHKNWIRACRANCGLTPAEQAYTNASDKDVNTIIH